MKTCRVTVAVAMMLCFIYTEVSAVPAPGKTETVILGQDLGETRELVYHPNEGERVFILAKRDVANQQEELVMDESWDAFKEAAEVVPSRVREKRGCTKCCIMCCSAPGKCKQCCDCCVNPGNSRITF
ncbi:uncharacterized protein LOC112487977 isoform X1 [Cynoglossus semilaevis]|uniref:uncharacterized protein LOC112487977 isoform X1 n=1 Tax=Cynoglossus semilaevis TaxID=244447 RepID=UPI000D62FFFC|nr:uncharacterized protein LOC112487977 isoform X1 [Cynoglossus semilaevis]